MYCTHSINITLTSSTVELARKRLKNRKRNTKSFPIDKSCAILLKFDKQPMLRIEINFKS